MRWRLRVLAGWLVLLAPLVACFLPLLIALAVAFVLGQLAP